LKTLKAETVFAVLLSGVAASLLVPALLIFSIDKLEGWPFWGLTTLKFPLRDPFSNGSLGGWLGTSALLGSALGALGGLHFWCHRTPKQIGFINCFCILLLTLFVTSYTLLFLSILSRTEDSSVVLLFSLTLTILVQIWIRFILKARPVSQ
jgi:hypothetical protein